MLNLLTQQHRHSKAPTLGLNSPYHDGCTLTLHSSMHPKIEDEPKPTPPPPLSTSGAGPDEPKLWLGADGVITMEDGSDPTEYLRQFFARISPRSGAVPLTLPVGIMHFEGIKRLRRLADDALYRSD